MFTFIRGIVLVLILTSPFLIWSWHQNKNVKFELNICERTLLDGDFIDGKWVYEDEDKFLPTFIVICGLGGSAAGWSIDNNGTHDKYDENGQYFGTDTLIPNSKKVVLTCYPNKKSSPSSNKYYQIDGYPGSCKFPFNRGVEYRGPIYEKE